MRTLSKSKLMAFRQCPKRLWLEIHRPELVETPEVTQTRFRVGYQVGEIARRLYDPTGEGVLLNAQAEGFDAAFNRTQALLDETRPIFEGGFRAEGALVFADILLPVKARRGRAWRMIEVKSSTKLKNYHQDDASIQAFVARAAGVPLAGTAVAHLDSKWTYPGDGDYAGLLVEEDLTQEVFGREDEVREWIASAQAVLRNKTEPAVHTGGQCSTPYECPFINYCQRQEPQAKQPQEWLPRVQTKNLKEHFAAHPAGEMRDVPDELLNARQQRVKTATLSGRTFFDAEGAARALAHPLPAYFMDFETIGFPVPIWKGTRPYQQIPFQFSVHRIGPRGALAHKEFLDLTGQDPSRALAEALIEACGDSGPVFVYSATFENSRLDELGKRFPKLAKSLAAIGARVIDLAPIAREHYYHPDQQGSWSIKDILPAACPDLRYEDLKGVQDGGMAMEAFVEAIAPETLAERKGQIERQLLAYCQLDTYGMVRLWEMFSGRIRHTPPG